MSTVLRTPEPHAFLAAFNGLIAAYAVEGWAMDRFGNDHHDVPHFAGRHDPGASS